MKEISAEEFKKLVIKELKKNFHYIENGIMKWKVDDLGLYVYHYEYDYIGIVIISKSDFENFTLKDFKNFINECEKDISLIYYIVIAVKRGKENLAPKVIKLFPNSEIFLKLRLNKRSGIYYYVDTTIENEKIILLDKEEALVESI